MNRNLIARSLAVAAIGATAASCGYDSRTFEGLRATAVDQVRLGQAVSYHDHCPTEVGQPQKEALGTAGAAIALPLAVAAVDFAIGAAGQALEDAKEGLNGQFLAMGAVLPARTSPAGDTNCLVVYRGLFGPLQVARDAQDDKLTADTLDALGLADFPAFYMEIRTEQHGSGSDSFVEFSPRYIYYAASSARRSGSGRKNVSLVMALGAKASDAVQAAGDVQAADPKTAAEAIVARFNLGRLEIGSTYAANARQGHLVGLRTIESGTIARGTPLAALVTETEEPPGALKALTEAFTRNRDAISKGIADAIKSQLGAES